MTASLRGTRDFRVRPVRVGLNLVQYRPLGNSKAKWRLHAAIGSYYAACVELQVLSELDRYLPREQ